MAGCAGLTTTRDRTLEPDPGRREQGSPVVSALTSPTTWLPIGLALALQIDNADHRIGRWADRATPVFGSRRRAADASETLRTTAGALWIASAIAMPSPRRGIGGWLISKTELAAVGAGASALTTTSVEILKRNTGRERPDGSNDRSLPSGHAASATVFVTLASANASHLGLSPPIGVLVRAGCGLSAAGAAWARVEARKHYPSDVLVGAAIGHLLGSALTGLVDPARDGHVAIHVATEPRLSVDVRF